MTILRYRDYQGGVEFDEDKLTIRLLHIDDLITTEIDRASEAQSAFEELVDDYLASCVELGKQPSKPFKGSFNVRVSPALHKQAAFAAIERGETLNSLVQSAIEEALHGGQDKASASIDSLTESHIIWNGFLRLSLVTCPITMIAATQESDSVWFDQIDESANALGDKSPATSLEIEQFVPKNEIDYLYLSESFYIVPTGKVGHDAYAVIREVIRSLDMAAIARVVSNKNEQVLALEARGNGLLGTLVRYPHQVRDWTKYLAAIQDVKVSKDMLDLAKHIVETKSGRFDPEVFWKHRVTARTSQDVMQEAQVTYKQRPEGENVVDLMQALRASIRSDLRKGQKGEKNVSRKPAERR